MKIIKEGDKGAAERKIKQTKRFECLTCEAVFECDYGEWKYVGGQYDETPEATCPTCGRTTGRIIATR